MSTRVFQLMILTGSAIIEARRNGEIVIEPFSEIQVNPNSYNYRLAKDLIEISGSGDHRQQTKIELPTEGFVLQPDRIYIGAMEEVIGSNTYVMTLLGRSTMGRLGLFLNVTADLGHLGSESQWTLELHVVQPLRVYPGVCIGQVAFWSVLGGPMVYSGRYHNDQGPVPNRDTRLEFLP
jgi:dCTP deaminase